MGTRRPFAFYLAATFCCLTAASGAQSQSRLAKPDALLNEEFSRVGSVRELSDGRLLLVDTKENGRPVAYIRSGTVTAIGRAGNGPGEYSGLETLLALATCSTLVAGNERRLHWLVLAGSAILATLTAEDAGLRLAGRDIVDGDTLDRQSAVRPLPTTELGPGWSRDLAALILVDRARARVDTLDRMRGPASRMTVSGPPQNPMRTVFSDCVC